jgi:DNA-binding MarR family transcriptional regulator
MKRQGPDHKAAKARVSPAHRFLIYKIGVLRRLLDRYSNPAITDRFGLTVAEWRVLTHLYAVSPITARQLGLRVHADKAEISRACAGLVKRGLATRKADAKDRRSALLAITPRGERLHDAIIPLRQALQDELEIPLTARELAELHRLLDKLKDYMAQKVAKGAEEPPPAPRPAKSRRTSSRPARTSSASRDQAAAD